MSQGYTRLPQIRRWMGFMVVVSALVGLGTVMVALVLWGKDLRLILPYMVSGLALMFMGGVAWGVSSLLAKMEDNTHRIHGLSIELQATQNQQTQLLLSIRDSSQISDGAKSITHRHLEREALRKAIREDIVKGDWEAAYNLIEEMQNRFGYRLEAYNYRKEVDEFRAKVIEDRVQTSVNHIRSLADERKWDQAKAELERVLQLAPNELKLVEVVEELKRKKESYKATLLQLWHEAVEKKDVDRGIELLKELDPYLTREESDKLEDSARTIFKAKILDYAAQFRAAVTRKSWSDAVQIGEQICRQFPNSQLAHEVGESMEALRSKASAQATSSIPA